jgi:hypothetical protein
MAEIIAWTLAPSPGVDAALTTRCMWLVLMSWQATASMTGAANRSHRRRWGVRVLAGPPLVNGEPVRIQVVLDKVRAGSLHVRRVGR